MSTSAFRSVVDYSRPLWWVAASHPLGWVPVASVVFVLALGGHVIAALATVIAGFATLAGLMCSKRLRAHVTGRARLLARCRAAEKLDLETHREWQRVLAIAERTTTFNPRAKEVEALLDTFINVALALSHATACAEKIDPDIPTATAGAVASVARERREMRARIDTATAALRAELELVGQLVRARCEAALSAECEGDADLWVVELDEARRGHTLAAHTP